MTLDGADKVSVDDVFEFLDFLEAQQEQQAQVDERSRREAEANAKPRTKR